MAKKPLAQVGELDRDAGNVSAGVMRTLATSDRDRLVRLAYRFMWNQDEAEDAVHDALILARSHDGHLGSSQNWWAWIRRILINRCHERGRKRQRRIHHEDGYAKQCRSPVGICESHGEDQRNQLRHGLDHLPRRQREVLVLRHMEGLPFDEIAGLLEISPSTARVHARAGRETLRRLLKREPAGRTKAEPAE